MGKRSKANRIVCVRLSTALALSLILAQCGCRQSAEEPSGDKLMVSASDAWRRGEAQAAIDDWKRAEEACAAAGDLNGQCRALSGLAAGYESIGQFEYAEAALDRANAKAAGLNDADLKISLLQATADLYVLMHLDVAAQNLIDRGLAMSVGAGHERQRAGFENALGNLREIQDHPKPEDAIKAYDEAIAAYKEAGSLARQAGDHRLAARALTNAAGAAAGQQNDAAYELAQDALTDVLALPDGREKSELLLGAAQAAEKSHPDQARDWYHKAQALAEAGGDQRTLSYALADEGRLCQASGQLDQALDLTRRAMFIAQSIQDTQALYRWQWQTGRILAARSAADADPGTLDEAINSYSNAVSTLEPIRHDLTLGNGNGLGGTFRQQVGSIYYELADLLLRRADRQTDPEAAQRSLQQARATVELLKSAQIEDYFQDRCAASVQGAKREVESIDPHAAVIYFIPLPDRTEILVSIKGRLSRFKVALTGAELDERVKVFSGLVRTYGLEDYRGSAKSLYDALLLPLEPTLKEGGIDTLVFVPDGALRSIPFGALFDGKQFVIERYAVAVTPGLTLMNASPISRQSPRVLEAGLSEAQPGYPALKNVPEELKGIESLYGGRTLLNQDFKVDRLREELSAHQYTIVHIASHAEFVTNSHLAFLLAYDKKISLDDLQNLVSTSRFHEQPLELLTLCACQTAAGDDRAELGLAGVAIKAGARSALATLWVVNDDSSKLLIAGFYKNLRDNPGMSKARALQLAQLSLWKEDSYKHPEVWAPYLMIGNWL